MTIASQMLERVKGGEVLINVKSGYRLSRCNGRHEDIRKFILSPAGCQNFAVKRGLSEQEVNEFISALETEIAY